jgi:hypothetical protein
LAHISCLCNGNIRNETGNCSLETVINSVVHCVKLNVAKLFNLPPIFYINRKLCTMTIKGPAGSYSGPDGCSPKTQSLSFSSFVYIFLLYTWKCTSDFVNEILCAFILSHTHATYHVYILLCFLVPCTSIIGRYSVTEYLSVAEKCFLIDLRTYGKTNFHVDGRSLEWLLFCRWCWDIYTYPVFKIF